MPDFTAYPLWLVIALFLGSGVFVWLAGTRLARYADTFAERSGISHAFVGALMLGGITSLPEVATTVASALANNVVLAVNNALGGAAVQVTLLALADVVVPGVALSTELDRPVIRLEAALLGLLLTLTAMAILVGEPGGWPVGIWSLSLLAAAVASFFVIHRFSGSGRAPEGPREMLESDEPSPRHLVLRAIVAAIVVLVAGAGLALSGDAIGQKTGLGSGFVGVLLVGVMTSLPEISTTIEAVRLGRYEMAFSNVLGTNFFNVALLGVVDVVWLEGPALAMVGRFSAFAALLGALLTGIYLTALVIGRHGRIGPVGGDSLLVVLVYLGGLALLYQMRGG